MCTGQSYKRFIALKPNLKELVLLLVKKFIIQSFEQGYRKLLIVTGKGKRSKVNENPYISSKFSVLKNCEIKFSVIN